MWRKDRALNKETKVRLKRALVWPVATYGCESWTLKASDKKRIAGFEMTASIHKNVAESVGKII